MAAAEVTRPTEFRSGSSHRARSRGFSFDRWALVALPPFVFLCIFFAYPLYKILEQSVTENGGGLSNYRAFFGSAIYVQALVRTFVVAGISTAVCIVLGYPYAYLMTRVSPRWRNVLIFCVLVPFWTSLLVRTYAWTVILQDTGVINRALQGLGIVDQPVHLIRTTTGVVIGMSQILLPFMVLPLFANMRTIDSRYMRAAGNLGATPFQAFRSVYLPLSLPGLAAGSLIVFIYALGFYITPAFLGSPSDAVLSQLIVMQVSQLLDFGFGAAMGGVLLALTLILIAFLARATRVDAAYKS
ncbi:MAG TPA: ABC transporter permease [Conexibacter sp.]|nr:ABC transporter permease [Conexibacter sp.]